MAVKTIKDAAKAGCKDLIADYDTLIGELEKYFIERIYLLEKEFGRPPMAKELFYHVFISPRMKSLTQKEKSQ